MRRGGAPATAIPLALFETERELGLLPFERPAFPFDLPLLSGIHTRLSEPRRYVGFRKRLQCAAAGEQPFLLSLEAHLHCAGAVKTHMLEQGKRVIAGNTEFPSKASADIRAVRQKPKKIRPNDLVAETSVGKGHGERKRDAGVIHIVSK